MLEVDYMKDKKIVTMIICASVILCILILVILLPLGKEEEAVSRIPEDVNVFEYPMVRPASCYLADEKLIALVKQELSEFPDLEVEKLLFYTEDFEIFYCVTFYGEDQLGILLDTKMGEIIWNVTEDSKEELLPDGPTVGGGE